jgi:hypothetical protein
MFHFLFKALFPFLFMTADDNAGGGGKGDSGDDKKFTQQDVNNIVEERLSRERKKYEGFDDLKKFKTEHEATLQKQQQKTLEEQQEYEKLKTGFVEKEKNYQTQIGDLNGRIKSMRVDNALKEVVMQFNAFPESIPVLREQVDVDNDGNVKLKGVDTYGNNALIDLAAGAKQFFEKKPHLVRAASQNGAGSGTPPSGGGNPPNGGNNGSNLNTLADDYEKAFMRGDHKTAKEIKGKMQQHLNSKGVNRTL